jgi:hypothetical protein
VSSGHGRGVWASRKVADHPAVPDGSEVASDNPNRFSLGVAPAPGLIRDTLGALVAAQLGDRHAVEHGVDPPVATAVEAVTDRLPSALARGCGYWRGPAEAPEASLGEASRVSHLDEELGDAAGVEAAQLIQGRAGDSDQLGQLTGDLTVPAVKLEDGVTMLGQQSKAQGSGSWPGATTTPAKCD